jgi:hypothetical protein
VLLKIQCAFGDKKHAVAPDVAAPTAGRSGRLREASPDGMGRGSGSRSISAPAPLELASLRERPNVSRHGSVPRAASPAWPLGDPSSVPKIRTHRFDVLLVRRHGSTMLMPDERALLVTYCHDHPIAVCPQCSEALTFDRIGADVIMGKRDFCPMCRADLTNALREHLAECTLMRIQARETRARSREIRQEAREDAIRGGLGSAA